MRSGDALPLHFEFAAVAGRHDKMPSLESSPLDLSLLLLIQYNKY
jgi:hypothetical protein